jgi:hypothetical protein
MRNLSRLQAQFGGLSFNPALGSRAGFSLPPGLWKDVAARPLRKFLPDCTAVCLITVHDMICNVTRYLLRGRGMVPL